MVRGATRLLSFSSQSLCARQPPLPAPETGKATLAACASTMREFVWPDAFAMCSTDTGFSTNSVQASSSSVEWSTTLVDIPTVSLADLARFRWSNTQSVQVLVSS